MVALSVLDRAFYSVPIMIQAYENSIRLPSYDVLTKIALFFNVSIDFLFGFSGRQFLDTTDSVTLIIN